MSHEKIKNLIDQAPEISQWWNSSKSTLKRWFFFHSTINLFGQVIVLFGGIVTGISLQAWVTDVLAPGRGIFLLLSVIATMVGIWWNTDGGDFLSRKLWPQKLTRNGLTLWLNQEVGVEYKSAVLSRLLKISDPQLQPLLQQLQDIKDLELPKCWWNALDDAIEHITPKASLSPAKSSEEKLEDVYTQIDQATHRSPKVFRL